MKKIILISAILSCLLPVTVGAAFDFVVDQAISVSNSAAVEGQAVKLYTVVVNNNFPTFSGKVNFYNNGQLIGTTEIKKLQLEEARQVSISYILPAGTLALTTQLAEVTVIKQDGSAHTLTNDEVKNSRAPAVFEIDGDADKDGIGNKVDPDDDNDGLTDAREAELGTDPLKADTDGDGLTDQEEVEKKTDPKKADTDGDGTNDKNDLFPIDAKETVDSDQDGIGDNIDPDDDNDGLTDDKEKAVGADPRLADSDQDGVQDGADALPLDAKETTDSDSDGIGNNTDPDDDNDKILDEEETVLGTNPTEQDTDSDGTTDYEEKVAGTDPKTTDQTALVAAQSWYRLLFDQKWKQIVWLVTVSFGFGWLTGRRREY